MRYIIDKENRPVYLQLYKQIRDDIIVQNYKYNTKLPSKRSLAEETGVSTITVVTVMLLQVPKLRYYTQPHTEVIPVV